MLAMLGVLVAGILDSSLRSEWQRWALGMMGKIARNDKGNYALAIERYCMGWARWTDADYGGNLYGCLCFCPSAGLG